MENSSLGYLNKLPAVGPTRERSERMMKGFSIFFNLYSTWADSISDFQNVSMEAMERIQDRVEGEIGSERYKEFYNTWIETYSETFKEFMISEHFARDINKFISNIIDAQKYSQEMLEENYLKPMNLPTKTDIDDIYKELYSLRKKVKELTFKINELSGK